VIRVATAQKENKLIFTGTGCWQTPFDESRSGVVIYQEYPSNTSYTFTAYNAMREYNTRYKINGWFGGANALKTGEVAISFERMKNVEGMISTISANPGFVLKGDQGLEVMHLKRAGHPMDLFDKIRELTAEHFVDLYKKGKRGIPEFEMVYTELVDIGCGLMDNFVKIGCREMEEFLKKYSRYLR
jgi:hypothetical protein